MPVVRLILLTVSLACYPFMDISADEFREIYNSISTSCGYSDDLKSTFDQTWKLGQTGKVSEAQSKLNSITPGNLELACEDSTYELSKAMLQAESEEFIPAIDTLDQALKNELIPVENKEQVELQIAIIKVRAKRSGVKLKRKYRLTSNEKKAVGWNAFVKGELNFNDLEGSGFLVGLAKVMPFTKSNVIEEAEELLANSEWESLAKFVIGTRDKGLDVDYYYLALAANGMGLKKQARIYTNKSIDINQRDPLKQCVRYQLSDVRKKYSYCANHKMPRDSKNLLAHLDKQELDKERRQAEAKAKIARQKTAAEAARKADEEKKRRDAAEKTARQAQLDLLSEKYPTEWVDAILNSNVIKGMSQEAVRESKGPPDRVEVLGMDEMWSYGSQNIVFSGGVVSFISR